MACRSSPNLIFWTVAQTGRVTPLVSGPPGCGKSRTFEAFAKAMGRQCYTLIGSLREPADIGGYPYPVHGEHPYMAVMPPKWAQDCQQRAVGAVHRRADHLPAGRAGGAAGRDCREPRGRHHPARYGVEARGLQSAGLCGQRFRVGAALGQSALPPGVGNRRGGVAAGHGQRPWASRSRVRAPAGGLGEAHRPQHGMVGAFHKHKPGLLEAYPKERAKASGPWPSIRSWTNAAICAAALEAIDAEPLLRYRAIAGCVGEEAALEFQTGSKLDLPDPEEWLLQGELSRASPRCRWPWRCTSRRVAIR